jgi:ferredoxin
MDEDTVLGVGADRAVHLRQVPRLLHLHRVRPLPVAVPGVEHRQAAVAQDADHGPARPPVRQGPVPARQESEGRGRDVIKIPLVGDTPGQENAVIDYDVLWSCTTCGACVEECPVDIQHVDTIVDMRRYKAMMESSFPQEAGVMLRNVENAGDPWGVGPVQARGVDREARLRHPRRSARHRRRPRDRVPVLGRLRRRGRRPLEEDHPGHRAAAPRRGREVRDPRQERDLHRRPGPPPRHGVPVPDARAAERRAAEERRADKRPRSSRGARTASTRSRTSTPTSTATSRCCTTPRCSPS